MNWQDKIDEQHTGQTGFFKEIEIEQIKTQQMNKFHKQINGFKVTTTMTGEFAFFNSMEEVKEHISCELQWFNLYEKKNRYNEDDFIVNQIES